MSQENEAPMEVDGADFANSIAEESLKRSVKQVINELSSLEEMVLEDRRQETTDVPDILGSHLNTIADLQPTMENFVIQHVELGVLDAKAVSQITSIAKECTSGIKTDTVNFNPNEFAMRLLNYANQKMMPDVADNDSLSADQWEFLGSECTDLFNFPPRSLYIADGFQSLNDVKAEKIRKTAGKADKTVAAQKLATQLLADDVEESETTSKEVQIVFQTLKNLCTENDGPVWYFEFVLDPNSFGKTVENMFYVSFLVKEGKVKYSFDGDQLPILEPVKSQTSPATKEESEPEIVHSVINLSYEDWQRLVKTFKVTQAAINHDDFDA